MLPYIILEPQDDIFNSIIGEQNPIDSVSYHYSRFLIRVEDKGYLLLYSCLTGELLKINDIFEARPYLIKHWFLVPDNIDEQVLSAKIRRLINILSSNRHNKGYSCFEIITTTCCNASCFYCYEKGYPTLSINDNTAEQISSFILNTRRNERIELRWFGGEPLVNSTPIDIISKRLADSNVDYYSTMTSNGYLFTRENIQKAKTLWKLSNVKITLDGTKSIYNTVKAYKNQPTNAFGRVLSNIDTLLRKDIAICIRLNIEEHNINDVSNLIEYILTKYINHPLLSFAINRINNVPGAIFESTPDKRRVINNYIIQTKRHLMGQNVKVNLVNLPKIHNHLCEADNDAHILVKPNGELAFCPENFNNYSCGSVFVDKYGVKVPLFTNNELPKTKICEDCLMYCSCILSPNCPSGHACDENEKNLRIEDVKLSMIYKLRNFI